MRNRKRRKLTADELQALRRRRRAKTEAELEALGLTRYVTTRHLCMAFGFTRQGIKKLRDNGTLPEGIRIGQTVAWPIELIKAKLASLPAA